jgi:hypothetical protein
MDSDLEITLMQWMSIDELAHYNDALATIEREEAFFDRFKRQTQTTPQAPFTDRNA